MTVPIITGGFAVSNASAGNATSLSIGNIAMTKGVDDIDARVLLSLVMSSTVANRNGLMPSITGMADPGFVNLNQSMFTSGGRYFTHELWLSNKLSALTADASIGVFARCNATANDLFGSIMNIRGVDPAARTTFGAEWFTKIDTLSANPSISETHTLIDALTIVSVVELPPYATTPDPVPSNMNFRGGASPPSSNFTHRFWSYNVTSAWTVTYGMTGGSSPAKQLSLLSMVGSDPSAANAQTRPIVVLTG